MKNIWILTKLEIKKYFRQPMTIGFGFFFPLAWIIINGESYGNNPSKILNNFGTVDFMFPAYIFMIMLVMGLSSLPLVLAKNYENKAILRYSFTPLKKYQYLCALFLGGYMVVIISVITMLLAGIFLYHIHIPSFMNIILLFFIAAILMMGVASLGIIIASIFKGFQSTLSVSLFTYFILLFLSGSTIPSPVLPSSFKHFVGFVPYGKMVDLLRNIWLNTSNDLYLNIGVSLILTVLSFLLAIKLFKWKQV